MSVATATFVYRHRKTIGGAALGFFALIVIMASGGLFIKESPGGVGNIGDFSGVADVPPEVMRWEPTIRQYAKEFGVEQYVPVMLAMMAQESGGVGNDPMQSSEGAFNTKYCKEMNCIQDPIYSIWAGVQEFKDVLTRSGGDIPLGLQSYNFGPGFIDYAKGKGGYSVDNALEFSRDKAHLNPGGCKDPNNFRTKVGACYGDYLYAQKIMKRIKQTDPSTGGIAKGSALGDEVFGKIMQEALKYNGWPYLWAGNHPSKGFDCSGITSYVYKVAANITLPRTAQEQYDRTSRISESELKPGDLIFFHTAAYNYVTHVGIYTGGNQMYDSNNSGIGYHDFQNSYWKPKIVGYGRVR